MLYGAIENSFENRSQKGTDADLFTPIEVRLAFKKWDTNLFLQKQLYTSSCLAVWPSVCLPVCIGLYFH